MTWSKGIGPNLTPDSPCAERNGRDWPTWRPKAHRTDVVHTVLWRALPRGAPRPPGNATTVPDPGEMAIHGDTCHTWSIYHNMNSLPAESVSSAIPSSSIWYHVILSTTVTGHWSRSRERSASDTAGSAVSSHVLHVDDGDIMKSPFQDPRIRNQRTHTTSITALQNTDHSRIRPPATEAQNVRDCVQVEHTILMQLNISLWGVPWNLQRDTEGDTRPGFRRRVTACRQWGKVGEAGGKVGKIGKNWQKLAKIGKNWQKLAKSWKKVGKSSEK